MARSMIEVSVTEMAHFRRLVQFLSDADDYGRVMADDDLCEMARRCRVDLLRLHRSPPEDDGAGA